MYSVLMYTILYAISHIFQKLCISYCFHKTINFISYINEYYVEFIGCYLK